MNECSELTAQSLRRCVGIRCAFAPKLYDLRVEVTIIMSGAALFFSEHNIRSPCHTETYCETIKS